MPHNNDLVPNLGLVLDHARHRVTRGSHFVDIGGEYRLWQILTALAERHDAYLSPRDLRASVWGEYPAEDGTIWGAISTLRRKLRSLDVTVQWKKNLGYRLEKI